MSHTLITKAFFFNVKTDYLPYYKNFTISLDDSAVAKDILTAIQEENENFSFPELNLVFKINNLVVDGDISVTKIVNKLGKELTIEPVNSYRSNNGLIINNNDFMQSFELLSPYATKEDKAYYKTLYALHYASETEKYDHEYIGDAILILAHKMISEGNEYKKEILNAITSVNSGLFDCEYENNLFEVQDHTQTIETLKNMVRDTQNNFTSILTRLKSKIINPKSKVETKEATIDNLEGKRIAYYATNLESKSNIISQMIIDLGAKEIQTTRNNKLSGLTLLLENKTLAYKKAGLTLLDAFDSGAEILIIEDIETYNMMKGNFINIENTIGRKMIGLELISSQEFIRQVSDVA